MKVKRELNEIMELSNRLCNAETLCDGSCNAVPEELSEYYDVSEYAADISITRKYCCPSGASQSLCKPSN